jgi:predicted CXXCH cytochrome family protein
MVEEEVCAMRRFAVGVLVVWSGAILCGTADAAITGSAHDFSTASWNFQGEICQPCHTPHDAVADAGAPLWNHLTTKATFQLYASPTFNGSSTIGQPSGTSKLCLSCHDGTVALDSFGGFAAGKTFVPNGAKIGTDLRTSHPISFAYDAALVTADRGLFDPMVKNSGLGSTIQVDLLHQGKMECTSCHNVHNQSGADFLLVKSNAGSALCLTCHNK